MHGLGKIVNLTQRRKAAQDMGRDAVERHWHALAGGDVPYRRDVDPAEMSEGLDRVMVIERIAPRQARIRVAGQRVSALPGTEAQGMPLSCLVTPKSREWLGTALAAVFEGPAIVDLGLAGPRGILRARAGASLLLLPLRDGTGAVNLALGYLTLPDRVPPAPFRFDIAGETRATVEVGLAAANGPEGPNFETADRARRALRRRRQFRLVESA